MPKLSRNMLLMAKAQTARGTPAVPTAAANAILCQSVSPSLIKAEFVARNLLRPYMGNSPSLVAGEHRGIEFVVELASSGTAGTAPAFKELLLGCGLAETISAGVSATYSLVTSGQTYLTLICNLDGMQFTLTDAIGTASLEMNPKGIPVMRFSYLGIYTAATDTAMPTGVSFTAFMKPFTVGKTNTPTFSLHGTSPVVEQFSIDLSNEMTWRELIGWSGALRTDRKPTASLVIELPDVATRNWGEQVRLGTEGVLQVIHGIGAGNIFQLDAPKASVSAEPTISDSGGVSMLNLQMALNPNLGNDELVLTFK